MTGTFGGEAGATEETTAFANAMIFDGSSAELQEGCVRVASVPRVARLSVEERDDLFPALTTPGSAVRRG